MSYRIDWIGTVAIGLETRAGRPLGFSLEEGQQVPPEFKVGDRVDVRNYPADAGSVLVGFENNGYYEITHISTGVILRTMHRADLYKVSDAE